MLEELIKKEDTVRIFKKRQETNELLEHDIPWLIQGRVFRVSSDTEMEIITEELQPELQKNVCYVLYFFSYEKVFLCTAYFQSFYSEEKERIISFELLSPLERVQRRMHQRASTHAKFYLHKLEEGKVKEILQQKAEDREFYVEPAYYEEAMIDISAGGIRFTAKKPIRMGEFVFLKFDVLDRENPLTITSFGQIIYSEPFRNEQSVYDVRLKFVGMTEHMKEKIIRYVFQMEREKRKSGGGRVS